MFSCTPLKGFVARFIFRRRQNSVLKWGEGSRGLVASVVAKRIEGERGERKSGVRNGVRKVPTEKKEKEGGGRRRAKSGIEKKVEKSQLTMQNFSNSGKEAFPNEK